MLKINIGGINGLVAPGGQVDKYMQQNAVKVAIEARRRAPGGPTGRLKNSIVVRRRAGGGWTVVATAPYAIFVHQGTPPHPIEARNRKALAFTMNGEQVVVKRVKMHPGTPANPFLAEALAFVIR